MMIFPVVNIIDCLATVIGHDHNYLIRYMRATNNQPLLIIVAVFYHVIILKTYAYGF